MDGESDLCLQGQFGEAASPERRRISPLESTSLPFILRIEAGDHFIVLSAAFAMSVTSPCLAIVIFHSVLFLWGTTRVRDLVG